MDSEVSTNHEVRVLLLGPFELLVEGELVEVPRARVRDLLTLLAMRAPNIVSFDSIIDGLWADKPPKDPLAALRVVLSRSRTALGPQRNSLTRTPAGLRLFASTDVEDFLEPSLDETDIELFTNTLALWRGESHIWLLPATSSYSHAQRLVERRTHLLLRLTELLTAQGRCSQAVKLLEPETLDDPLSEPLAMRLATAYATLGRKADALRTLECARQSLRTALGVNPGLAFTELERNVLNDAVDICAPTTPDASPAASSFVGRVDELERLIDTSAQHLALVGEPGIGKTRLLDESVLAIEAQGSRVIRARCPEAPDLAMQVLSDVFTQVIDTTVELSSETARALQRVDRSLAADPDEAVLAPIRRSGLIKILADFLHDRFTDLGATLVLDDVHWIDRGSADVVGQLLSRRSGRVLMATRPTANHANVALDTPTVDTIALEGLHESHSRALITAALGEQTDPELISAIHRQSAGNPFFVELLTSLVAEGALSPAESLPVTALVAVQSRIDRLSRPSRQTLLVASIQGQHVDLDLLRSLRPSAERDIQEAIDEGLIRHESDEQKVSFVHALVAQGAYELLSEGQRSDLHDQAAVALSEGSPIEFSQHAALAEAHDPYRCIEAHLGAGEEYLRALSYTAALAQAQAGQHVADRWEIREPDLAARLCLLTGESLRWSDGDASANALIEAASLARSDGNNELEIDATLALCQRGQNTLGGSIHNRAVQAVDVVLNRPELRDGQRARLLAGSSVLFAASTSDRELRHRFTTAIDIAQDLGDEQLEAEILVDSDFGLSHPDDFARRVTAAQRLGELAGGDHDLRWEAAWLEFGNAIQQADADKAAAACEAMRKGLDLVAQRPREFGMSIVEAVVAQVDERYDEAEAWANHAVTIGLTQYSESWAMGMYGALLLGIRRSEARAREMVDTFEALLATNPNFPTLTICVAYAALENGDRDRSAMYFDRIASDGFDRLVRDGTWTAAVGILTEIASRLERTCDAAALYELLTPFAGRILWSGVSPYGPADASLAAAAEAAGRSSLSAEHRMVAAQLHQQLRPLGKLSASPPMPS